MAKRSRYGRGDDEPEDVAREDVVEEATTDPVDPRPAGSEAYRVVEPGTVIDGVEYPKREGPPETAGLAYLDPAQAQELVNCGVKLSKVNPDGSDEPLVPAPKEAEPEAEEEETA